MVVDASNAALEFPGYHLWSTQAYIARGIRQERIQCSRRLQEGREPGCRDLVSHALKHYVGERTDLCTGGHGLLNDGPALGEIVRHARRRADLANRLCINVVNISIMLY